MKRILLVLFLLVSLVYPNIVSADTCTGTASWDRYDCEDLYDPRYGWSCSDSVRVQTEACSTSICVVYINDGGCTGYTCDTNNRCALREGCVPYGGANQNSVPCNLCTSVDGGWNSWSSCYVGGGNTCIKDRACVSPEPSCGGADCTGSDWTYCTASEVGCKAESCPSSCGYTGGTVQTGALGSGCGCATKSCPATPSCCTATNPTLPSPFIYSPTSPSTLASNVATLKWYGGTTWGTGCPQDNKYKVYVETGDNTPDELVATLGTGARSYSFTGEFGTRYWWRIGANNGTNEAKSPIWNFTTCTLIPPEQPVLVNPRNNSNLTGVDATLQWNLINDFGKGCPNIDKYKVYISTTSPPPASSLVATLGSTRSSYNFSGEIGTTYYWRIGASNGSNETKSATRNFTTCTPTDPVAPILTSPNNTAKLTSRTVTLTWDPADFGDTCAASTNQYLVYVEAGDTTPDVLRATLDSGTTSYSFTGSYDRRFYWRVAATNGLSTVYSTVRSFYTPGRINGTLFDASDISSCALMGTAPKISGAVINLNSTNWNYSPTTNGLGVFSQDVRIPASYTVSPVVGSLYSPVPKLICQGSTADFVADGTGTITRDFGFWRVMGGWWQIVGGDVYGGGGIESVIPDTLAAGDKFLIKEDANGVDGLAYYSAGGSVELGGGSGVEVSNSGWQAESGYGGQDINYEYYMAKMKTLDKTVWSGSGKPGYNPTDGYEIYTRTGDATIDFGVGGGQKRIFMVDGNVTVSSNVAVTVGSHLTVIASGTITYASNVGSVQGWWVADRIVIASTGDTLTEIQFVGRGSFVGWDAIEFNRDRGVTNNTAPAELFYYRPDLMVNAPDALKFSKYSWTEQVP